MHSQYENFTIHDNDSIDDTVTRFKFIKITNSLASLGDVIDNDQKVKKVIRALPPSREVKVTTLKELNDKEERELINLIGNLKIHEMERKVREETVPKKKKIIAFKSTPTISNDDDEEEEEEEEEDKDLSLLVRNVRRMYNKAKINNRR